MKQSGFSLIELVIFIVVTGLLVSGLLSAFQMVLANPLTPEKANIATELAKARMELLIAESSRVGFAAFSSDPCSSGSPPSACPQQSGFNISSQITDLGTRKLITVTVSGESNVALSAEVTDY